MINRDTVAVGARIGKWTVTRVTRGVSDGLVSFDAVCECGHPANPSSFRNILAGTSTQCTACRAKEGPWVQLLGSPKAALRWQARLASLVKRCHNPKAVSWRNYGGRGITVWGPWRARPIKLMVYLMSLPGWSHSGMSIDRIDNDKGYFPGNFRMATMSQQHRNARRYRGGREMTKCLWCEKAFQKRRSGHRFCGPACVQHLRWARARARA